MAPIVLVLALCPGAFDPACMSDFGPLRVGRVIVEGCTAAEERAVLYHLGVRTGDRMDRCELEAARVHLTQADLFDADHQLTVEIVPEGKSGRVTILVHITDQRKWIVFGK